MRLPVLRPFFPLLLGCALVVGVPTSAGALTIVRNHVDDSAPFGPPPPVTYGGGNLVDVFDAAADLWEAAIADPHTVSITFGWAPIGDAGTLAFASPFATFTPISLGFIRFDSDGTSPWFLDPTPGQDEEFFGYQETFQDLGGGLVNTGRQFGGALGDAAFTFDLLTLALHEIGHLLGLLDLANLALPDPLVVDDPLPHAGTTLQTTLTGGGHLDPSAHPDALMVPFFGTGERTLPSGIDILGAAERSGFTDVTLDPLAVPEPSAALLLAAAAACLGGRRALLSSGSCARPWPTASSSSPAGAPKAPRRTCPSTS